MFPDFLNDGSHAFAQDKMFIRGDEIKDANINNKYTFAFINSCLSGDISYLGKNNANQFRGAFKIENGAYLGWAISPVIKDTFTYGKLFFEKLGEKDANGVYNSAREVQTYLSNNNNLWGGTILYGDTTVRK